MDGEIDEDRVLLVPAGAPCGGGEVVGLVDFGALARVEDVACCRRFGFAEGDCEAVVSGGGETESCC